jgi:hypothetical protein
MTSYLNPDGTLPWQGALESDGGGPVRISFRDYVECCCGSSSGSSSSSSGSSSSSDQTPWHPPCGGCPPHSLAPMYATLTLANVGASGVLCDPWNGTFVLDPLSACLYVLSWTTGDWVYQTSVIITKLSLKLSLSGKHVTSLSGPPYVKTWEWESPERCRDYSVEYTGSANIPMAKGSSTYYCGGAGVYIKVTM